MSSELLLNEEQNQEQLQKSPTGKKKESKKESKNGDKTKPKRKKGPKCIWVNVSQAYYPLVREALEGIGYKMTDSDTKANLFWINSNGNIETAHSLLPYQFYNHFPGMVSISRKVDLAKNIENVAKSMPEEYSFHPKSFILPSQFIDMKNYMLSIKKAKNRTFIVKPDTGSLGKGIFLVQDPNQCFDYCEQAIAQKYIDPYLIDGLKFDLRIYVLVTSIDPLRIYVHEDGMARFCTEPYQEPSHDNLEQVYCHLTNYSLNKKNENFQANQLVYEEEEVEEKGHKRSMASIFESIKKDGHDVEKLKHEIDEIIRLTIASAQTQISSQYRIGFTSNDGKSRCFEILGFDIMIDNECKPWLLEVNNKPSMAAESPFDKVLKTNVIQGAMKIINLKPNFKKQIGQRFHELAQLKSTNQRNHTLSDYEGETERAKETKWRQLYPLLEGDVSNIEKAIDCARVANGYKPRKLENQLQPTNSTTQLPSKPSVTNKGNNLHKTQSQIVKDQQKSYTKTPPISPLKPTVTNTTIQAQKPRKIVTPVQQKFLKQRTSGLPNQFRESTNTIQPQNNIVNSNSNTYSTVSPQRARTLTRPPRHINRPPPFIDESPMFIQMKGLPVNKFNPEEESERIRQIKRQQQIASNLNTLPKIRAMISISTYPQRAPEVPITGAAAVRSLRFSDRSNQKQQFIFKKFKVGELVV